jgi:hypothetical protein
MRFRLSLPVAFACLTLAVPFAACKPKMGASCKIDRKEVCGEKATALVCQLGTWQEMSCRGPKGCAPGEAEPDCDQTIARAGDICNVTNEHTCSEDKKSSLLCKEQKWVLDEVCSGPLGCVLSQGEKKLSCDASVARDGDKCSRDNVACGADKKSKLVCRGGKYALVSNCRGDLGCRRIGDTIDCDDSLAVLGDLCAQTDHYSCSTDGKQVLKCDGAKFNVDEACKNRKICKQSGTKVGCL